MSDQPTDVVASVAVTLDGYIAQLDGEVGYLEKYPMADFDFAGFLRDIGALIMGSTTYLQAVEWGWQWDSLPTLVLTSRPTLPIPAGATVEFADQPASVAIPEFSARTPGRLWVFGGGQVITDGIKAGVVDTLDVTVVPELLGQGIPLFTSGLSLPVRGVRATPYNNGAVRLIYSLTESGFLSNEVVVPQ